MKLGALAGAFLIFNGIYLFISHQGGRELTECRSFGADSLYWFLVIHRGDGRINLVNFLNPPLAQLSCSLDLRNDAQNVSGQ